MKMEALKQGNSKALYFILFYSFIYFILFSSFFFFSFEVLYRALSNKTYNAQLLMAKFQSHL